MTRPYHRRTPAEQAIEAAARRLAELAREAARGHRDAQAIKEKKPMKHRLQRAAYAFALSCTLVAGIGVAPADASTASRLRKLERQAQAQAATNRAQAGVNATLRAELADANGRIVRLTAGLSATATLLLGCFQSTSMDLDAATSIFTGTPFIAPSLNSSAAGPFYLATLNPLCVGAITPPIVPGVARSSRRMFPTAPLRFPALP